MGLDRERHLRVIDQPLDHVVAAGELERFDGPGQPGVEFRDRALEPLAEEPTHRGKQEVRGEGHGREGKNEHKRPERQFDHTRHGAQSCSGARLRAIANA